MAPDIAVDFQDARAPGEVVQTIDVLGDQSEGGLSGFQTDQRVVRRVGCGLGNDLATPVVPLPDEARIARKSFGSGEVFGAKILPEPACAAEGWNAALGGNARAGERRDVSRRGQKLSGACEFSHSP
jgi:hypothetical protein